MDSARWCGRLEWMERAGDRWWPVLGGVYLLTAVKRVRGMRMLQPRWKEIKRQRLFKMGAKSEAFCRQALTVLDKNRQVAPSTLDLDSALAALATIDQLRPRAKRIVQLAERLRDSEQLLGANVAEAVKKKAE